MSMLSRELQFILETGLVLLSRWQGRPWQCARRVTVRLPRVSIVLHCPLIEAVHFRVSLAFLFVCQ